MDGQAPSYAVHIVHMHGDKLDLQGKLKQI